MTTIVAVVSDLHCNHKVGLCPEEVKLEGIGSPGRYIANEWQKSIWRAWQDFWACIKQLKEKYKARLYTVALGDLCDLQTKHEELITANTTDAVKLTVQVLRPVREISDVFFVVRGTEYHSGESSMWDELVAHELEATKNERDVQDSWWWLRFEADKVIFDAMHHPANRAYKEWTMQGAVQREADEIRFGYRERGVEVPDVALRGHVHYHADSGRARKPQVFYLPSWQLCTSYGHKLGVGGRVREVGGMWVLCDDGHYFYNFIVYKPMMAEIWRKH